MQAAQVSKLITPQIALGIAAAVVGLYLVYKVFNVGEKAVEAAGDALGAVADAAKAAAPYVNPADQRNVVNSTGTALYQLGDEKRAQQGLTLSTAIVDFFNFGGVNSYDPNEPEPPAPALGWLNR